MSRFGRIFGSETSLGEITFNKNQTLTSESIGVHLVHSIKDHIDGNLSTIDGGKLSVTGSHWAFIHNLFYLSGSTKVSETNPDEINKFNSIYHKFGQFHWSKPIYNTKFYDLGIVTLTETASWSGSVNYTDIGRTNSTTEQTYNFWDLKFNSTLPIYTSEYSLQLKGGEFNSTMNQTAKIGTGSADLLPALTGSDWFPYFNQVQLYTKQSDEPAIIANLPRAVKVRDDVDIIITFRMDH